MLRGGAALVVEQAQQVESPSTLGITFGEIADENDDREVLPKLLRADASMLVQFAGGYVWARFRIAGWTWADSHNLTSGPWKTQLSCSHFSRLTPPLGSVRGLSGMPRLSIGSEHPQMHSMSLMPPRKPLHRSSVTSVHVQPCVS